ncbi:MAG: aspartate--tRNA ligase [Gemmatimonadales bacterium]|nr:MAG: aspartate--tRNA ligase [Gemmatimonadales bacterium]
MTDQTPGATALRTSYLGGLTAADVDRELSLVGWVHRRRLMAGDLTFLDLRDRTGLLQASVSPEFTDAAGTALARELGAEDVVRVTGTLALRPDPNPELPTGEVELRVRSMERLNAAETPAIPVYRGPEEELPSEELRLRHRSLDLRRPELQSTLELRHRLILAVRNHMDSLGFLEVETPILTKPTPEGARDYLVPSRVHPGEFYALPQSPQIYKQILMVSGFDRYFQIARCFRDEDLRADRQPEFTQIDVEASFVGADDILGWMEGLMSRLAGVGGAHATAPFPRMTWDEAMERFGSDRPDLRWELEITDWTEILGKVDSRILQGAVEAGGRIRGLMLRDGARLSRREIEAVEGRAKAAGAPGLLWAKRTQEGSSGPLAKFAGEEALDAMEVEPGDLVLVAAGSDGMTSAALDAARVPALEAVGVPVVQEHAWLWVTDFPVFEDHDGALGPNHHPFVLPHPEFIDSLEDDPLAARGAAYDLVYNGSELGSGSIRIHDAELQRRIFRILGLAEAEIDRKFGFLLGALKTGAPPHGGIALGMDRIVQRFAQVPSLRDVIAFPKTTAARALFEGAPTLVDPGELEELHIRVRTAGSAAD